jgi:hypothetical protein
MAHIGTNVPLPLPNKTINRQVSCACSTVGDVKITVLVGNPDMKTPLERLLLETDFKIEV